MITAAMLNSVSIVHEIGEDILNRFFVSSMGTKCPAERECNGARESRETGDAGWKTKLIYGTATMAHFVIS